jgi:transcriptional regulator with XRE-family HTH domain
MTAATSVSPVGALLREWRAARGKSQLALAVHAGVSARHLSFIETGRAAPSRDMVLLLSDALEVPLRERNALLGAAGYAPLFQETSFEAPEMDQVRRALDALVRAHGNNPAIVVNRRCDVLMSNDAARIFMARLLPPSALPLASNMVRLIFSRDGARPFIENWEEVASEIAYRRLRESPSEVDELLRELDYELPSPARSPSLTGEAVMRPHSILLPIRFRRGNLSLDLFSTVTTLVTPFDVTVQELRVESMFPANPHSERQLAAIVDGSAELHFAD